VIYASYGIDWAANTATLADDYEFRQAGTARVPGLPEVIGKDEYVPVHAQVIEIAGLDSVEVEDVEPRGDGVVVVLSVLVVQGGAFRQQIIELHVFRDGHLWRQTMWFDRDEGRREIGT
jgi:ketosteroid isomerase-like protein